ncbi:MAG: winged helix-turn-helix domain-containing protein [Pyrinomonadaceae bacterium]
MSLQTGHLFEFDEYRLDLGEKLLKQGEAVIPLTPKVFETLQVLVENAGRLVEKDQLMQEIWQDRFVEESNLTYNIKMLRKALGDSAAEPRFIETVPRRGYRFIAEVRHRVSENGSIDSSVPAADPVDPPASQEPIDTAILPSRSTKLLRTVMVLLCVGVFASGVWFVSSTDRRTDHPVLSEVFSLENLSSSGRTRNAVISPDGKTIAYTNGVGTDPQSVWIRQLETSNNIQIIPPSNEFYYHLTFSPDGNFLYFVRGAKPGNVPGQYTLYRISVFGGITTKIVDEVQGDISLSPDGNRVSFVRCQWRDEEWCSLWIAEAADGSSERKLASRRSPFRIGDNRISPDGRKIVFGVGQSRTGANEFGLAMVDIESGAESEPTPDKYFDIRNQVWLPDQSGMLITAQRLPDKHFRIWQLTMKTGKTVPLTRDSEDYWGLSLDNAAAQLVATQRRPDFQLHIYRADDLTRVRQVFADAATVRFAQDGTLLVAAGRPGNVDLWGVDPEGGTERQLTNDPTDDLNAVFSPADPEIYFASNRSGETHVWKMKADGSDQTKITRNEGGYPLAVSPDGRWLYYHSGLRRTLMRVSLKDGREELIVDKLRPIFAVSQDCEKAAFVDDQGDQAILTVVSLPDGAYLSSYTLGTSKDQLSAIEWSSDGRKLFYVVRGQNDGSETVWVQPLGKNEARMIADLPDHGLRNSSSFAISPDGMTFAVIQGNWTLDAVLIKGLK